MKILAIRGKNLASLEKEFEVDFTVEPLKSAGIFAITGSTGSGKSTLLDALCLALFDSSPRTNRALESVPIKDVGDKTINQRDSRNILRRGAGEGYAEVEFVALNGQSYVSRWSVRRSKNKADSPMRSSEIYLYNLSAKKEEQGVKTELLRKISNLIGLSFEQFTRSVLLAQGDFATFLKAKQSEKAELLEKLTGTDIYSRISIAIFEKAKSVETEWLIVDKQMKGIELIPDEKIIELESESDIIKQDWAILKKDCELLTLQLKWIEENERITNEVKQAETALDKAQKQITESAGRFEYITQIESVQDIRETFGLLKNTEKQLSEQSKNLLSNESLFEGNAKLLTEAEKTLSEYEIKQEQLIEKQREIAPQIIKARELDVQIKENNTNTEDAQKEFSFAKATLEKTEKNIIEIKDTLRQSEKTLSFLNSWFAENKAYENIAPRTELLINLSTDALNALEQKKQNSITLESNKGILVNNTKQLEQLKQEAEKLEKLLPEEIAALREKLNEGEPCPVCGSVHHPFKKTDDSQHIKEQDLKKLKDDNARKTEHLTNEIEKQKNEIARLSVMIENYSSQYDKAFKSLESYLSEVTEWEDLFGQAKLTEYLKTKTNQWNNNTEEAKKTQENITRMITNLENEESKLKEASGNLNAKNERLTSLQKIAAQLKSDRDNILHGKPADAAERYFVDQQKTITDNLKKATDNRNNYSAKKESLNGMINQIKENIAHAEEKRDVFQREVNEWLKTKASITPDKLTELLMKDSSWIHTEKQILNALIEAETAAKATLVERHKNIEQHSKSEVKPEIENKEFIQKNLEEKSGLTEIKNKRHTEIAIALSSNTKAKEQIKGLEKELEEKKLLSDNWKKLNSLLGSATGNKFKEIAQGYTLETLLTYTNKHLEELSPRYRLQRIPETLALQVVDLDMLNETRTIHSLSGGESFLISLALALGLSSLSSNRMKVESLFIDEGFGSLDNETLRVALDSLERLQSQGRKIGVISHVIEMTERIAVKINVIKTSSGKSKVEVANMLIDEKK
jgi:ATPase involved in DNA repair